MSELHELSAVQQRQMLEAGEIQPSELVAHYLDRIEALNPRVHAFTTVTPDAALERAEALERGAAMAEPRISGASDSSLRATLPHSVSRTGDETIEPTRSASGAKPPTRLEAPLWGLPFADKDLSDRAGVATGYGSRAFANNVPLSSSPVVEDMDSAGGISLGKTNVPEFGFPAYAENRLPEGHARNPWDTDREPGGSSAGAAVAVAARMLPFAPGNDGGGSVRIPAAACGLVGLKPSRGRVPGASGIDSLGGLAVGGPLARSVADAALLLDGMCHGPDRFALRAPRPNVPTSGSFLDALDETVGHLRIGWNTWSPWASQYRIEIGHEAEEALDGTIRLSEKLGHSIEHIEPAPFPEYVDAFRAIWMGGAAGMPLPDEMLEHLEPLTGWLIRTGRTRPAGDLPAALATLARFESRIIADYSSYDIVLTPMLSTPPPRFGSFDAADGNRNFIQQCQFTPFTSYVNVAGLPAISLPVAQGSLPMAVQTIGRPGDEVTLLRFAAQLEAELRWFERIPPVA
ncbi:amidase [Actinomycetaceae bacterium L2_0104]